MKNIRFFSLLLIALSLSVLAINANVDADNQDWTVHRVSNGNSADIVIRQNSITTSSPYLTFIGSEATTPNQKEEIEVQVSNFGVSPKEYKVILPPPDVGRIEHGGDFVQNLDGTWSWSGVVNGGNLIYETQEVTPLPYVDLGEYGIESLCQATVITDCDDELFTINLGIEDLDAYLYENRLDYFHIATDGFVIGSSFDLANTELKSSLNRYLPETDQLNEIIAPLWRNNTLGETGGVYVGLIEAFTPTAPYALYINWDNVELDGEEGATANYAVAIDVFPSNEAPALASAADLATALATDSAVASATALAASSSIYFIYDHVTAPELTVQSGFTVGVEAADGERATMNGYAPCASCSGLPFGYVPTDSTIRLAPRLLDSDYNKTLSLRYTQSGIEDHDLTSYGYTQSDNPIETATWSTIRFKPRYRQYLPVSLVDVARNEQ